ncbi:MAG: helicase HerA domain-containing protein [bacterium]|jgi:DNA helicase HerA-like ATPase
MQVVGETTQQEIWVASKERKFRAGEMLVVEDADLGRPVGTVVETRSYNRFIPLSINHSFVDKGVLASLKCIGYNIDEDEINIARVRLLEEASYPVRTGSDVRLPAFGEVKDLLLRVDAAAGMVLGVIKSTGEMAAELAADYRTVALQFDGASVKDQNGVPFIFDIREMQQYPHIGIFGGSGSGKSFGLRVMLEELMKLSIPTLVFDPHYEMDFSEPFPGLPAGYGTSFTGDYTVLQIGRDVGVNFSHLSTRDLINLLGAASTGGLSDSMANAVETLHKKRDSYQTFSNRVDCLAEALEDGKRSIEARLRQGDFPEHERKRFEEGIELLNEYGSIPLPSVRGIVWRLRRLSQAGLFNHNIRAIETAVRSGKLTVVQGPIWLLQVFAAYVIGNLYRQRRDYKDAAFVQAGAEYFPPFVVVTDEAHNFAPKAYESPTKSVVKEIAQEGRKYGVFLILATQRPTLLDETVTAQLNTKFVFRTVRATDIDTIKEETDLTPEEARSLPFLRSGDSFVSSAIWGRTMAVRIRAAKTVTPHKENPFDELKRNVRSEDETFYNLIKDKLPVDPTNLVRIVANLSQSELAGLDVAALTAKLDRLVEKGMLQREKTPFGSHYKAC